MVCMGSVLMVRFGVMDGKKVMFNKRGFDWVGLSMFENFIWF